MGINILKEVTKGIKDLRNSKKKYMKNITESIMDFDRDNDKKIWISVVENKVKRN